ncbi:hypothetical protein BCR34DRAFT_546658 [Clohesyomyces aquaticus]|uniref:Uncharacterized protein n=1 Tax=Clohesyomyces aquaticus TaxID=1231657 RepID=A0A1Y1YTJ0_9PLEO|nr:hypothetical protein BCR34DRAFT_546658 [Clohesyomyces aquaticus]
MDPLSATASVIAVLQLSSKVVGYLTDVKDASKERARCAIEACNLHSLLLNLRFRLDEGSADTSWYTAIRALAVKSGPLDQFKQALELLQTKMTDGGRVKNAGEALLWKFKKEEIASILDRMERLKSTVEIALQMDHFKLSQAIVCNTRTIKDDTASVRVHVEDIEYRNLLEWVSPLDYPAQQSDVIKRRQEGTGQWFLDAPEVAKWRSEAKATLFCPGIPGAGKTMAAAIAIDSLLKSEQDSSVGVAYVYCNYKDRKEQDVTGMLAAILKQLLQDQPSLAEPLTRLHEQHAHKGTRPSADEISTTLQSVILELSTVYIVVDALDECRNDDGTRRWLLARIRDLQSKADVRFLATSRFLPDIIDEFKELGRLEVRACDEDVRRFVAGQVHRLPNCIQRKHELQELVQDKIAQSVDGMFLLARLHTDSLLDKRTPKEIKVTLARLSKGSAALDGAYKDAIQRIEGQLAGDCERAKNVLSWITYAQRPLTTAEICHALAVEHQEEELDPENVPDMEELVSVYAGLVVVDEESRIVRLVHYTTQEYLERIRETWNPKAQLDIALTCLTYLSFGSFKKGSCSTDAALENRLQCSVFLDYAAKYWVQHTLPVQDDAYDLACSFLLHRESISCATQVMSVSTYRYPGHSKGFPHNTGFIHLTARFGLTILLKRCLESGKREVVNSVDSKDSYDRSGLYIAAENGHAETVNLLLDKGADLLFNKGANINAQGGHYGNALQAASYGGHEQVVKLLLDKGADVNAQGGRYGNAFHAAAYEGHLRVLELLMSKETAMPLHDRYGRTLLWWAAAGGNTATVEVLVTRYSFDPLMPNKFGQTPFWIASKKGYIEISEFLGKECGDTEIQRQALPGNDDNRTSISCDVCTLNVKGNAFHFHCQYCAGGDWDMCAECKGRGAFCEDATHLLVKRTTNKGNWVEVTS